MERARRPVHRPPRRRLPRRPADDRVGDPDWEEVHAPISGRVGGELHTPARCVMPAMMRPIPDHESSQSCISRNSGALSGTSTAASADGGRRGSGSWDRQHAPPHSLPPSRQPPAVTAQVRSSPSDRGHTFGLDRGRRFWRAQEMDERFRRVAFLSSHCDTGREHKRPLEIFGKWPHDLDPGNC
jgi:hypothetical protein